MKNKTKSLRLFDTLAFHWKHAMRYRKQVATSFIVGPISIILERYIAPIFIAGLLTAIQLGTATLESSVWLIVGYAFVQLFGFIIGYRLNLFAMWSVQIHGAQDIYREAYEKISQHSLTFHNNRFAGSLVSQVTKTTGSFFTFWNMVVFEVMFAVVAIIATLVGVFIISWPLAIVLAVFVSLYITIAYLAQRFMRKRQIARSKAYSKISGQLSDSISNMVAIKIESKEANERQRLGTYLNEALEREKHVRKGVMTTTSINSVIVALARISALIVAVWAVQSHAINAGAVFLLITYTFNLLMELWNINTALRTVYQINGDSEELLEIMQQPIDIIDSAKKKLQAKNGAVSVNAVSFAHDGDEKLFRNLNLSIPAGQKVGIVGMSGSGKTTLTKLLLRLNDPAEGSITIDGQDISQVSLASLHDAIAYVPQEPLLFHRSLRENISYSRQNATDEAIVKAAKDAQAFDFIEKQKDGLETLVGERGVKLSGGQRQRIAIARALLKDAPVLILDEATSALDSASEQLIQKGFEKLMRGRTSIVIAHRLSTISKLDRIIVMDNGKIIEDGTHSELISLKGQYAQLWAHQSGGFIED